MYFAPDGRRLLAERRSSPTTVDLWMIDVERGAVTRFLESIPVGNVEPTTYLVDMNWPAHVAR